LAGQKFAAQFSDARSEQIADRTTNEFAEHFHIESHALVRHARHAPACVRALRSRFNQAWPRGAR
jgi:hypothetical protein